MREAPQKLHQPIEDSLRRFSVDAVVIRPAFKSAPEEHLYMIIDPSPTYATGWAIYTAYPRP